MRPRLGIGLPPNGFLIRRKRRSLSPPSSAPATISPFPAPRNSLLEEKLFGWSLSLKILPLQNFSLYFATRPAPRPLTVPADFSILAPPPTASISPAS